LRRQPARETGVAAVGVELARQALLGEIARTLQHRVGAGTGRPVDEGDRVPEHRDAIGGDIRHFRDR
jgi:hypothetical protein